VLEFNCRFGDPETQVVLPLLAGDFGELCLAVATGRLNSFDLELVEDVAAVGVVMASGGYPGPHRTGLAISGLEEASQGALVFQAGTTTNVDGDTVTSGGRVLSVVGLGPGMVDARLNAYAAVEQIAFEAAHFRRDIGARES
jgi:phosphoribosylamine--glycine ligase